MRHNIFDSIPSDIVSSKDNVFANFLQTAGLYDSMKIDEDNIADLIELLKGNVKISAYCKECKQERVFSMKPIEYYFETGPEGDEEISCASLGEEIESLQNMIFSTKSRQEKSPAEEWKWINWQIADTTRLMKLEYICSMDEKHHLDYIVLTTDNSMMKIGQYPSIADMTFPELDDLFKHVVDKVEGLYTHWFLGELGNNWSDVCADELATYGKVLEVPQQEDFYRSRIQTSDTKVFVIISDAMRYEVAATMADQLQRETQSKVSISSMQSIFPSTTKFGMAALLPHKELTVEVWNDILTVLADGQSTASTYRERVLKTEDSASVALKYNEIIAMKRAERSALVKGMDVVYIYHDTIDEASHTSDTAVFAACDKAISELKNLVRIIVNEFGGTNILITADHGFLYTYSPLKEEDKVDKRGFFDVNVTNSDITKKESIKRCVEYGRRYAIMQKGVQPDYLMPVKFLGGNTEFDGFAPRESIRIKMNGGGMNFVHGGISLQEMVVPVIEYHYLRNDSMEYRRNKQKYDTKPVTVNLLSANRKISNMIFSLNFYQKDAVSTNREAAIYQVYFTDEDGKQISDIQKIIADKTSDNGAERTFRCQFNLKSLKYSNTATYYLVIADEQGLQMPQREPFQIDIAFAVDEFDFFN